LYVQPHSGRYSGTRYVSLVNYPPMLAIVLTFGCMSRNGVVDMRIVSVRVQGPCRLRQSSVPSLRRGGREAAQAPWRRCFRSATSKCPRSASVPRRDARVRPCSVRPAPHGLTAAAPPLLSCPGRLCLRAAPACARACRAARRQVLVFYAPQMEDMAQRIAKACNAVQLCTVRYLPRGSCRRRPGRRAACLPAVRDACVAAQLDSGRAR
jgi:hypothetical protein